MSITIKYSFFRNAVALMLLLSIRNLINLSKKIHATMMTLLPYFEIKKVIRFGLPVFVSLLRLIRFRVALSSTIAMLFCFSLNTNAQNKLIDSLIVVIQKSKPDTSKLNTLYALSKQLVITGQYEKALVNLDETQSLISLLESKTTFQKKIVQEKLKSEIAKSQNLKGVIYHRQSKYPEALSCYFKALKAREEMNDKQGIAMACNNISGTYGVLNDETNELKYLQIATKNFEAINDKKGLGQAYFNQSLVYYKHGEYDKALEVNLKAEKYSEEAGDKISVLHCMLHTANILTQLNQLEKANGYILKALVLGEQTGDKVGLGYIYGNLGANYREKGDYEKSSFYLNKYLKLEIDLGDKRNIAAAYQSLGYLYAALHQKKLTEKDSSASMQMLDSAIACFSQSIQLYESVSVKEGLSDSYSQLGLMNFYKKDFDAAYQYYNRALITANETGQKKYRVNALLFLSDLFAAKGDSAKALNYYRQYAGLTDSLMNETSTKTIAELNTKYETEKKEKQITLLEKQQQIDNAELVLQQVQINKQELIDRDKSQQLLLVSKDNEIKTLEVTKQNIALEKQKEEKEKKEKEFVLLQKESELQQANLQRAKLKQLFSIAGIIALLLFGGFTFYRYKQRKLLSEKLASSLTDLKQTQEQLIITEKQREQENVRLRISRDIHDEIGSSLTKIALLSEMAVEESTESSDETKESLQRIATYSRNVNSTLSEIIWAVNPQQDTLERTLSYMRYYTHGFLEGTGINETINFPEQIENRLLNPEMKRNLFLVLKESLNNAVKYSKAKNISVAFVSNDNDFEFSIKDDGVGFDINEKHVNGNGLNNMEYRMKQSDCNLKIVSSHGNGCEIIVNGRFI
ncbi:MAG: tetratricopeptide repeat protein [Bacteroidia bacterium]